MAEENSKLSLLNAILEDEEEKAIEEEEVVHLLLERKLSKNTGAKNNDLTFGAKMSDRIAKFAGSWPFIISFISCLIVWIAVNVVLYSRAFDPYPFILLNLVLSCVAAIQAPVIMMSQNRQEEKDRLRAQNDYKTNLKAEIIVEDMHQKIDQLLVNQNELMARLEKMELREKRVHTNDKPTS